MSVSALAGVGELRTDISVLDLDVARPRDGLLIVSAENGRNLEFETGGVVESMVDEWQRMLEAAAEKLNAQNKALNDARYRRAIAQLSNVYVLGLIPPILLFVFGWSVMWALRGFKKGAS